MDLFNSVRSVTNTRSDQTDQASRSSSTRERGHQSSNSLLRGLARAGRQPIADVPAWDPDEQVA